MSNSISSSLGRGLRGAWRLLDATRRTLLNLLLLALLGLLAWWLVKPGAFAARQDRAGAEHRRHFG